MPNFRLPRSRSVMLPPDYNFENMYAGRATFASTVNRPFAVGLFNSSTSGQVLVLYGWSISIAQPAVVNFDLVQGDVLIAGNNANPLNPLQPSGPGVMSAGIGTNTLSPTAGCWEFGAEPEHWPYPWPSAVIPAGYTWLATVQ
ncbi:MAG: hypothetical protein ACRETH_09650, partial [Steroidobacteraceae bacterium]